MQNKAKPRILYLNYTSILTQGILLSQVVIPMKKLAREGYRITLVSGERIEDLKKRKQREALHRDLEEAGVEIVFFRKTLKPYLRVDAKRGGHASLRALCFIFDLVRLFLLTGTLIISRKCRIVHARSYVPALIGLFYKYILGIKLIFDPRGLLPEELIIARGWSHSDWRFKTWKFLERILLKHANYVIALSRHFKRHLFKIVPRKDIFITPCCIDAERFIYDPQRRRDMRIRLGLGEHFTLVYSIGCFVPYQVFDEAMMVFDILREIKPDARLLILTPEPDLIRQYSTKRALNLENVSLTRAPFSKVPDYLMACDAGLLVRFPSLVSAVASPVKFPEYLACGLPVLSYKGIGDTEFIIRRYSVGECMTPRDPESIKMAIRRIMALIEGYGDDLRSQCRSIALRYFSWESYLPVYRKLYGNHNGEQSGKQREEKK